MHAARVSAGIPSSFRLGQPLPGYRLIRRRGWGGVAEVWEAEAPGGFLVALKLVRLSAQVSSGELRAMEVVRGIRHPNLLALFGAWQDENLLIIGMELADRSLWDRFLEASAQGLLGVPRGELLGYLADAAAGIDYLNGYRHSFEGRQGVGIQHRDLKPQNILLFGSNAKVADFGMVRVMDQSVASHTGTLTLPYAAPEFFSGHTSSQSDQYSLAVTYCQLRCGRLPFCGIPAEITAGHLFGEPDLEGLPAPERPIVARALSKRPEQRWPDCRAFIDALRSLGSSGRVAVPDVLKGQATRDVSRLESGTFFLTSDILAVPQIKEDPTAPQIHPHRGAAPGHSGARRLVRAGLTGLVALGLALTAADIRAPRARPRQAPLPVGTRVLTTLHQERTDPVVPTEPAHKPAVVLDTKAAPIIQEVPVRAHADVPRGPTPAEPQAEPGGARVDERPAAHDPDLWAPAASAEAPRAGPGPVEGPSRDGGPDLSIDRAVSSLAKTRTAGAEIEVKPEPAQATDPPSRPQDVARLACERGRALLAQHHYSRAIAAFTEAIQLDPEQPDAYLARGIAHHLNGSYRQALGDYNAAIRLRSGDANAFLVRGRVHEALGHPQLALSDFSEAIRLRSDDATAFLARGKIYHDRGAYDRALSDYTEAIRLRPTDPGAFYRRGLVRYHAGDNVAAIADFTRAIQLNPRHLEAYRARGDAYARQGDGAHAAADHDMSHRLSPDQARSRSSRVLKPRSLDPPADQKNRIPPSGVAQPILRAEASRANPMPLH